MATTYTVQEFEEGRQLNLTQPVGGITFVGATSHLLATDVNGIKYSYLCANDPSNKFAVYTTLGTEFSSQLSPYQIQLKYVNGSDIYFSPVATLKVLANIGT